MTKLMRIGVALWEERRAPISLAMLRIGVALMWIQNAGWKRPPDFGKDNGGTLYKFTRYAVDHEVFPPYAWFVDNVVLPNFTLFGWLTLLAEASIGAFLLVGLATRLFALAGLGQSLAITLSVLNAPHEWHWSYFLMVLTHITLLGTDAGRCYGLDGLMRVSLKPKTKPALIAVQGEREFGWAALALGAASIVGAVFVFVDGDPWGLVQMTTVAAIAAVGLGAVAVAGALIEDMRVVMAAGALYAAGAASILIGLAADSDALKLGADGTASTFSWFLAMGAGLLALGIARQELADSD